jgi:hypothetical protein
MKIAKVIATFDDLANSISDSNGAPTVQSEREKKVKEKYNVSKAEVETKKYVLVGVHDKQILPKDDVRVKGSFELFETQEELEAKMKLAVNIWSFYEFENPINDELKSRYETFFSGFLYYYDTELRNGMSDHTIWCDWKNKNNKDWVTVYLHPKPLRHPFDIPDVKDRRTKTPDEYFKLMSDKNEMLKKTIFNPGWTPPTINGYQTDPPSPTVPPPPEAF